MHAQNSAGTWLPLWAAALHASVALTVLVGTCLWRTGVARAQESPAQAAPSEAQDVEVVGSRREQGADTAVSVISHEELSLPGVTLPDALGRVPGLQLSRGGSSADVATASLRGSSANQIPVYLAGIRINDDVTGSADLSTVPTWMLERVLVYRGNAPQRADQLGIGGAIFLEPRVPQDTGAEVGALAGSFGTAGGWTNLAVKGQDASALVGVRVDGAANDFGYVNDQGTASPSDDQSVTRQNADHSQVDAWTLGHFRVGRTARVTTVVNAFAREGGIAGYSVNQYQAPRSAVQRLLAGVSGSVPCGERAGAEVCRVELATSGLFSNSVIKDPLYELRLFSAEVANRGQRVTQTARLLHDVLDDVQVGAGVDTSVETLSVERSAEFRQNSQRAALKARAFTSWRATDWFTVHALAAGECHNTDASELSAQDESSASQNPSSTPTTAEGCGVLEPSARLGAVALITEELNALINVARYVRVPTLGELYGTSPFVRGNPQLTAETSLGADAGIQAQVGQVSSVRLAVDAFGYVRFADDLINYQRASFGTVRPRNIGTTRTLGAEITALVDALSALRAELSLALTDATDTTPERTLTNDALPFVAPVSGSAYLGGYWQSRAGRLEGGSRAYFRSERFADPAGQQVLDAQFRLDLEARWSTLKEQLTFAATLQNLFDQSQYDVLGLPLPSRGFYASVEARW